MPRKILFAGLKISLLAVFFCTLAVMTLFEVVKQTLDPGITVWQSHIVTILFTSVLAFIIANFTFQSVHEAHRKASEELEKRIATEDLLVKSEGRLRTFIESADESIYTVDRVGKYLLMNTRHLNRLGISRQELQEKTYADLHSHEDSERFSALIENVITTRVSLHDEYEQEGKSFIRQLNPVIDPLTDEVIGITVISSDITERKRVENALRQANRKLNLLSTVTRHDINNQLTVLIGYLQFFNKGDLDPLQNEYVTRSINAAGQISGMIRFTEEYEKIGVQAPAWQACRTLVETAAAVAIQGKITVINDLPASTEVFADPLIIKVFYNLMDNAGRYGRTSTMIRFSVTERDGDHILVYEDDGKGVPQKRRRRFSNGDLVKTPVLACSFPVRSSRLPALPLRKRESREKGPGSK